MSNYYVTSCTIVVVFLLLVNISPCTSFTTARQLVRNAHNRRASQQPLQPLTLPRFTSPFQLNDADEKLVFDSETNRFYEADSNEQALGEEFFLIDKDTKEPILLTKEEKERIFLDSIQQYYYSGKSSIPDAQFDKLREDLSWEGSVLVTLNRNETLFINAAQAYSKGAPIISDKEWDDLKASLAEANSKIAVSSEPKCYVDTGVCKVTFQLDKLRTSSLYVPAALLLGTFFIGISYEVPFIRYNVNPLFALLLGGFPISIATKFITENIFFKDPFVASGPCPNCGTIQQVFFGDVLGVAGAKEECSNKCTNCNSNLTTKRSTLRVSTITK